MSLSGREKDRQEASDALMLPSSRTNPDAQTVDLEGYGIPCVLQLGKCRVRTTRGSAHGPHCHDCFQITICTHGSMTFKGRAGQTWSLLPGRMMVLPPNMVHRLVSNTRGNERYWLFLSKSAGGCHSMAGLPPEESTWLSARLRSLGARICQLPDSVVNLPEEMFRLLGGAAGAGPECGIRLRSLMLRLLLAIVDAKPCDESCDDVVRPIAARMARAPERAYPMDALVAETKRSPTTILNSFRRETGKTPHQYLMVCRIRKAVGLLSHTRRKVTDIALSLGFASSQHFASSFRREMGMTPRQWRAEMARER